MSFLHSHTEPCLKTELDLFSLPTTNCCRIVKMGILQTRVVVETRESKRILYKWSKRGLSRSRAYVNQSESANNAVHQRKRHSRSSCEQFFAFNIQLS